MIKLFPIIEDSSLLEYSGDSAYEPYKGIVLDKDKNKFLTISGMFRDKKEFYEKMYKKGFITRKVFEARVYDWIENNAKNTLEAYLMFSTAFSKWKNNNVLDDYYVKLLNDIPQMAKDKKSTKDKNESVLSEAGDIYRKVFIYPADRDGKRLPEYYNLPIELRGKVAVYPNAKKSKKFDDPLFYKELYRIATQLVNAPKYQVVLDNPNNIPVDIISQNSIYVNYNNKVKSNLYRWGGKNADIIPDKEPSLTSGLHTLRRNLETQLNTLKNLDDGTNPQLTGIIKDFENKLNEINTRISNADKENFIVYTPEEKQKIKDLGIAIHELPINKEAQKAIGITTREELENQIKEWILTQNEIKKNAVLRQKNNFGTTTNSIKNELLDLKTALDDVYTSIGSVDSAFDKKQSIINKINRLNNILKKGTPVKLKSSNSVNTSNDNAASQAYDYSRKMASTGKGYTAKYTKNEATADNGALQLYLNGNLNGIPQPIPCAIPFAGTIYETDKEKKPLDELMINTTLNQKLFDGEQLRPDVRNKLLEIANIFKDTLAIDNMPSDIYLTGSSANYNYTDNSDLDLHLVYNFDELGVDPELLLSYFVAKKQLFNNNYDINVKGIPVEVGVENINTPIVSSGVYSVLNEDWVTKPVRLQSVPDNRIKHYTEIVQEIESAIESNDSQIIGDLWTKLYDMRRKGLKSQGEFGPNNLLFKKLRDFKFLDRLRKAYYSAISKELSLEAAKVLK